MAQIRGLTYPLQTNGDGGLKTSIDYDLVREHILSVLETRPYERVMNATYGLTDQVFEVISPDLINSQISKAILDEVEEVTDLKVIGNYSNADDGIYEVKIKYSTNGVPQAAINFKLLR